MSLARIELESGTDVILTEDGFYLLNESPDAVAGAGWAGAPWAQQAFSGSGAGEVAAPTTSFIPLRRGGARYTNLFSM